MKRIRCPKCDSYITFDETRYTEGQTLVFECNECHRQFGIRIGKSKLLNTRKNERRIIDDQALQTNLGQDAATPDDITDEQPDCGHLLVIENVFHYKQTLPLRMGDNVIGRYQKGNPINTPIETVDPSVDLNHCTLNVSRDKRGELKYILRDNNSNTGTFVDNVEILPPERRVIEHGTLFTIGATSIILKTPGHEDD